MLSSLSIPINFRVCLMYFLIALIMILSAFSMRFFLEFKDACKKGREINPLFLILPNGVTSFLVFILQIFSAFAFYVICRSILTEEDLSSYGEENSIIKNSGIFFKTLLMLLLGILIELRILLAIIYKVQKHEYGYRESNLDEVVNYYVNATGPHKKIGSTIVFLTKICFALFLVTLLISAANKFI